MSEDLSFRQLFENLRPSQRAVLETYGGGRMGISAVPGSGKTFTLSMLAADIILSGDLEINQEVLIVTMSNSAVDNFAQRIGSIIEKEGLLPGMGYRVRTLHGLAHDIVRERPSLVNLANDFTIVDEREAELIKEQVSAAWLRANPNVFDPYLRGDLSEYQLESLRSKQLPQLVQNIAFNIIRFAKDSEFTAETLRKRLDSLPMPLPLAEMGCEIYQEYQRALNYRGAVDFDDLIRLALAALRADPRMVARLRHQWPFILEDEAQDSSRLQEEILKTLAGENGNWVRVGDPNQAIYETFTTANPQHLIDFIHTPGVSRMELPVSGRSTESIIRLANHLIDWSCERHPAVEARGALRRPLIRASGPDDPQPSPPDAPAQIYISNGKLSPDEELDRVMTHLIKWQTAQNDKPETERETLAVLHLRNDRGAHLANALRKRGVEPIEMLGTTSSTRKSAGTLTHLLRYLANPHMPNLLVKVFTVWRRGDRENIEMAPKLKRAVEALRTLKHVEEFLYPQPGRDWLSQKDLAQTDPEVYAVLEEFRQLVRRWHQAALLPIDQGLLLLAQDVFSEPADLAIAHKLAAVLRQASDRHPTWQLPELSGELETIAKNKRRFIGFSDDDQAFDPDRYRGRIVVTTMHKAKGLEWDRVYLLSANNYDFPSGMPHDQYVGEKWYIRDRLNLEAEALAQLKAALSTDEYDWYQEGSATQAARLDCVRERLRLLFVAITRARRALIITWNTGRGGDLQMALPAAELQRYWENELANPLPRPVYQSSA